MLLNFIFYANILNNLDLWEVLSGEREGNRGSKGKGRGEKRKRERDREKEKRQTERLLSNPSVQHLQKASQLVLCSLYFKIKDQRL